MSSVMTWRPARSSRDPRRAHHSRRGPAEQGVDRQLAGRAGGHDAAVGAHGEDRGPPGAEAQESRAQPPEVLAHPPAHVGVDHGDQTPLVLAALGPQLVRGRDVDVGVPGVDEPGRLALVGAVDVAVEEADGEGPAAGPDELVGCRLHLRGDQRPVALAGRQEPLAHLPHQMARHQGLRLLHEVVLRFPEPEATQLEEIAESARHDEAHRVAGSLEQRVHGEGRAVDEERDGPGVHTGPREQGLRCRPAPPPRDPGARSAPSGLPGGRSSRRGGRGR